MPASLGSFGSTAERVQRLKEHTDSSQSETASDSIGALDAAARLQRAKQRTDSSLGPTSTSGLGAAERVHRIKESIGTGLSRTASGPRLGNKSSRGASSALQRSAEGGAQSGAAGETQVPEGVRDVISSPGRSLDTSIQRAVEDRMGDSLGDVRIHTGPKAAQACEQINARAFTVGNHVAFNSGEYDPSSPEGQHVLAHELAHVRQQTGGAVSMLPQENLGLEIDPDPQLEREAEETAQRVMEGGELGIQRLGQTEVHIQRLTEGRLSSLKEAVFGSNEKSDLSLQDIGEKSGVDDRLYALAENQKQLQARVDGLSSTLEGNLFQKMGDAGTGEALKMGMTEAGKESGLPFGKIIGSLSGAALRRRYTIIARRYSIFSGSNHRPMSISHRKQERVVIRLE